MFKSTRIDEEIEDRFVSLVRVELPEGKNRRSVESVLEGVEEAEIRSEYNALPKDAWRYHHC